MYSFNSETKELFATSQDLKNYIDICHKELERCAAYPEQSTENFNKITNINIDSDVINPQNKLNWREENHQEDSHIPFNENGKNKSIIASKKIEPNVSETIELNASKPIEPNASNKIEQIVTK